MCLKINRKLMCHNSFMALSIKDDGPSEGVSSGNRGKLRRSNSCVNVAQGCNYLLNPLALHCREEIVT